MTAIIRYFNTVKYLKFKQIYYRVFYFVRARVRTFIGFKYLLVMRSKSTVLKLVESCESSSCYKNGEFSLLNRSKIFKEDIDWNYAEFGKLWTYNLTYFEYLHSQDDVALIYDFIDHIEEVTDGLEPFPISLRTISWIKFITQYQIEDRKIDDSLYAQYAILQDNLEYHLLGNHLLENGFSLLFGSYYFHDRVLYNKSLKILTTELNAQILADGAHFELSPMYHQLMLFRLLDCINLLQNNQWLQGEGEWLQAFLEDKAVQMLRWLGVMSYKSGEIPFFNDSANNIAPTSTELFEYADRLSLGSGHVEHVKWVDLPESGYSRIDLSGAVVLIDRAAVGPDYLPGHAHADTLSFELSLYGQRVVVNSGTSVYGAGKQRQLERGTAAHATVVIDGENSSEVWGGFRVARRAKVFNRAQHEKGGVLHLSACHDGYKRLTGKPVHCREWLFAQEVITVKDTISGKGEHEVMSVLPLHPDVKVGDVEDNQLKLVVLGGEVVVKIEEETGIEGKLEVLTDCYHPEFGVSVENRKLVYRIVRELPVSVVIQIQLV